MESGFQESVVSNVGAIGVMQLLPGTWAWVDQMLARHDHAANLRREHPRRRPLPPLAPRSVRRRPPARPRRLLPGRPGRPRPRPVRGHEALRRDHPEAVRHASSRRTRSESSGAAGGVGAAGGLVDREAPEELGRREDLDVEGAVPACERRARRRARACGRCPRSGGRGRCGRAAGQSLMWTPTMRLMLASIQGSTSGSSHTW